MNDDTEELWAEIARRSGGVLDAFVDVMRRAHVQEAVERQFVHDSLAPFRRLVPPETPEEEG